MKIVTVKRVVMSQKLDVLFLQETKCTELKDGFVKSVWGLKSMGWVGKASVGASGGLWTVWNASKLRLVAVDIKQYSILTVSEEISTRKSLLFTSVYGPNQEEERGSFLDEIASGRSLFNLPRCVGGNFNVLQRMSERNNCSRILASMQRFSSWIENMELVDLPLGGASFTWSNMQEEPNLARLDKFLIDSQWAECFNHTSQRACTNPVSDHVPIILDSITESWGPTLFRFEIAWLQVEGFKDLVENWWKESNPTCWKGYCLIHN